MLLGGMPKIEGELELDSVRHFLPWSRLTPRSHGPLNERTFYETIANHSRDPCPGRDPLAGCTSAKLRREKAAIHRRKSQASGSP